MQLTGKKAPFIGVVWAKKDSTEEEKRFGRNRDKNISGKHTRDSELDATTFFTVTNQIEFVVKL